MRDDEELELVDGMPVENEQGDELGTLAGFLMEEDEDEAEFLILATGDAERLVPFEAARRVSDGGALVLDLPRGAVDQFPKVRPEMDPTDDEIEMAYDVYDRHVEGA